MTRTGPSTGRPLVVLVGSMGAGKTTVGRALAAHLGVGFRDTDDDVEAAEGRTVQEVFVDDGEQHFRALERAAVAAALREHAGVLALGGGAPVDPETRALLADHTVVHLRVDLANAAERVGLGVSRPMLLGNVRGRMKQLIDERTPVYLEVADHVVDTAGADPDEVVAQIAALLEPASAAEREPGRG